MSTSSFSLAVFLAVSAVALSLPLSAAQAVEAERPLGERMRESAVQWSERALDGAAVAGERVRDGMSVAGAKVREGASQVGEYAGDAFITAKVKAALVANESIKALEVHVDTQDGVVYLTGIVDTPEQIETAARVAGEVADVRRVDNRLTLRHPTK